MPDKKYDELALVYLIIQTSFCLYVHSYNGMVISAGISLCLLIHNNKSVTLFGIIQSFFLVVYILYQQSYSSTIFARQDDIAYVEIAMKSFTSFSLKDIFYNAAQIRSSYSGYEVNDLRILNLGYDIILGIFTRFIFLFKPVPIDYFFINQIPALGAVSLIDQWGRRNYGDDVGKMGSLCAAVYPSLLIHSIIVLKDVWVAFLVLSFSYSLSQKKYLRMGFSGLVSVLLRYKLSYLLVILYLIQRGAKTLYRYRVQISVLVAVVILLDNSGSILPYRQSAHRIKVYETQSGIQSRIQTAPLPLRYPGYAVLWIFSHFPPVHFLMDREKLYYLAYDLGSIYWLILFPFLIIGFYTTMRFGEKKDMAIAFAVISLAIIASGWIDLRWRLMSDVFAFPLIAQGLFHRRNYRRKIVAVYGMLGMLLTGYIFLRWRTA